MSHDPLAAAISLAKYWQFEYEKLAATVSILNDGTLIHVATAMAMGDGTPYVAIKDGMQWPNLVGKAMYASVPNTAKVVVKVPITAKMVQELRDKTDAPIQMCKKALERHNGDVDKAEHSIRLGEHL